MSIKERWKRFRPLPDNYRERLGSMRFEDFDISLAYLFGSSTREKGEDLDIAVLTKEKDLSRLRGKLYEVMNSQRIDLVNLKSASSLLRFEVVKNGVLLYKKDDEEENRFELSVIKKYQDAEVRRKRQREMLFERTERWS
ncbi:MAG: nucleotidyltransferase domain-containing protein [bacterium]|nr:nucleotidyltransferase domain-containing protein [bacterium]